MSCTVVSLHIKLRNVRKVQECTGTTKKFLSSGESIKEHIHKNKEAKVNINEAKVLTKCHQQRLDTNAGG